MAPNNFAVALGPKSKTRTMPQLSVSVSIITLALRVGRTTFLSPLPIKQMLATLMYINSSSNIFTCSHTRSNCKLLWDRDQLGQESKNHLSLSASLTRSTLRKLTWKRGKKQQQTMISKDMAGSQSFSISLYMKPKTKILRAWNLNTKVRM